MQAFGAFDKDQSSRISVQDFRRVLDLFCFKMTDSQWKSLLSKLQLIGDKVNYNMFLDSYTISEQEVGGYYVPQSVILMRETGWISMKHDWNLL